MPLTILTVDDAEMDLAIYRNVLKTVDARHVGFTDSAEGLEWTRDHRADLAIVDYSMPSPDGLEFIEFLRSDPRYADTPIIMITSETERDVRYRALELGASDFLTKPIDRIELTARVNNMLALADSRRKLADRAEWLGDEVRKATEDILARERETINRLMRAAEFRDNETGMHIVRMGQFCSVIARTIGRPTAECDMLQMAAPMHDIGKVATPDRVLLKPAKLDPDEWEIMKQHTVAGYEILKDSQSELLQLAAEIALAHHEKYDGTGYPNGKKGDDIPLSGRICAVSDVFDALTSERPYKAAWPVERAMEYINNASGTHFDNVLVRALNTCLPEIVMLKHRYAD